MPGLAALLKEFFQRIRPACLFRIDVVATLSRKLLQEFFLLGAQFLRSQNLNPDMLIAPALSTQERDARSLEAQNLP